jgi:hypothetical protein
MGHGGIPESRRPVVILTDLMSVRVLILLAATVAGSCECGNEPSGSIKHGECLD